MHGSLFHFQRLEGLTADASDGTRRPTSASSSGGLRAAHHARPVFFFFALEHINENLQRANLSQPLGHLLTCPSSRTRARRPDQRQCRVPAPGAAQLLRTNRNQVEGDPIDHTIGNTAVLGKLDAVLNHRTPSTPPTTSTTPRTTNQTFDVPLTAIRRMASRAVQNQRRQLQSLYDDFAEQAQRAPRDLRARNCVPATPSRPTFRPTRAMGIPHFASAIASSFSPTSTSYSGERRSRTTCRSCRETHLQSGRRVAAHPQRSGLSWLFSPAVIYSAP